MRNNRLMGMLLVSMSCLDACQNKELDFLGICIKESDLKHIDYGKLEYCVHKNNINKETYLICKEAQETWSKYMEKNNLCIKLFSFSLYCPYEKYDKIAQRIGLKMLYMHQYFSKYDGNFRRYHLEVFNTYYQLMKPLPEDKHSVIVSDSDVSEIQRCCEFGDNEPKESICEKWSKRFDYLFAHYLNREFIVNEDIENGEDGHYHTNTWKNTSNCIKNNLASVKELKKRLKTLKETE